MYRSFATKQGLILGHGLKLGSLTLYDFRTFYTQKKFIANRNVLELVTRTTQTNWAYKYIQLSFGNTFKGHKI